MSSKRKDEHVLFSKKQVRGLNDFDAMELIHDGLTTLKLDDIDPSTTILGKKFPYPIYINAMTGGTDKTRKINEKLALIAKKFKLPLFIGSQSIALKQPEVEDTFTIVREVYEEGFIVANVSANASVNDAKKAVEMLNANALAIHINLIQELAMGEGDRDFSRWTDNIREIIKNLNVPVIVKEVGFGMSYQTIKTLVDLGVEYIDISGKGGTNFASIERMRNQEDFSVFEQLGISTYDSLRNAESFHLNVHIYASGGIRHALDVIKALVLGAEAVGLSYYFLNLTSLEEEEMYERVAQLLEDINKLMLLFNAKTIKDLKHVSYVKR
jgi:isopentenyl-diphosphate delta-isomerase